MRNLKAQTTPFRTLVFIGQILFVLILLIIWLSWSDLRTSRSLWVLFFYSFPSEFLIAVVPHEPVLLYFAKFYLPLTVALIAATSTLLTESLNYSVFSYVSDWNILKKFQKKKTVNKIIDLFNRAPFLALWIAGLTPIPFYPFRFLVVMAHYPRWKYLLAVALSRTPRFFLLAWFGHEVHLSDEILIALFIILIVSMNLPFLRRLIRKKKPQKSEELTN
ncbi:MAG TPA: DedA family protein [Candidatus Aminicenantes bacterium]|nr:VTT domain-containing protein [Candidatus Aminicenantes bacterium]HHF42350.1 DedA family protein [Candidatus Aminicenantes bacterium]